MKVIPTPTLTQNDLHHCCCCSPPRRTVVTPDNNGNESYTCPRTGVSMRWSEGAQTYIQGTILIPGRNF